MSGRGAGQPQRYCTNCGAEIRTGTAFCVSCGASLAPSAGRPDPITAGSEPSEASLSASGGGGEDARNATDRHYDASGGSNADGLRGVALGVRRWFGGLPLTAKAALAGLVLLALFTVLSPLATIVAAVVFAVSLIALIIRVAQRRSVVRWGITAVSSLVLAFVFLGMSGALYGTDFMGSSDREAGVAGTPGDGAPGRVGDKDLASGTGTAGGDAREAVAPGGVDPAFGEIIDAWGSSGVDVPLLLPKYTPFPIDGVSVDPFGTGSQNYYVWSDVNNQYADHIRVEILDAAVPAEGMAQDIVLIDGQEYPYTEDTSMVTGTEAQEGQYTVLLWVGSEGGEEYWYYVEMNAMLSPLRPEAFAKTIVSMERLDPADV